MKFCQIGLSYLLLLGSLSSCNGFRISQVEDPVSGASVAPIPAYEVIGNVSAFAGTSEISGDVDGTPARFRGIKGIAFDSAGNLFVTDGAPACKIKKITPERVVSTFAGSTCGHAEGNGVAARFLDPEGIVIDSLDNIYVADMHNSVIRKITPAGDVTTWLGSVGDNQIIDGSAGVARLESPSQLTMDMHGNIYFTDANCSIRKVTPAGLASTILNNGCGAVDGSQGVAQVGNSTYLAVNKAGDLYISDSENFAIRKYSSGVMSTFSGALGAWGYADGAGAAVRFGSVMGIVVDSDNSIFVSDTDNMVIRKINADGSVSTLAGNYLAMGGTANGFGPAAEFLAPMALAQNIYGHLFVADGLAYNLRKIE